MGVVRSVIQDSGEERDRSRGADGKIWSQVKEVNKKIQLLVDHVLEYWGFYEGTTG